MERSGVFRRLVLPPALVLVVMAAGTAAYDHGAALGYGVSGTARLLVNLGAAGMFLSIWTGSFIAHPLAYFAGAGVMERIAAGVIPACVWVGKMLLVSSCIYSGWELAFLVFYPLALNALCMALANTGISEMACTFIARRRGYPEERVFKPWAAALAVAGNTVVLLSLAGGGIYYFYLFVDMYVRVFT
ncbi:MAG TPA: hypothetical protein PLR71_10380 [Deltaproteobacteria bacterium]|nr:hypothetical protein [Deltaproteobacteria bacterium]